MTKTPVLAILILAAGTGGFCALRNSAATWQRKAAASQEAQAAETLLLSRTQSEYAALTERIRELKEKLADVHLVGSGAAGLAGRLPTGEFRHPGPDLSERLLAELGFSWNSTGDFLVVSKSSLYGIRLEGMKGDRLSDAACQVLAMTPAERASIEALAQQSSETFKAWALAHVQRVEPEGDVVAKYTLQLDDTVAGSLSNAFVSEVNGVLGVERGELLQRYGSSWMTELGMYGGQPTTMTVKRYQNGEQSRLGLEVERNGGTMRTDVDPRQPMPETFRQIFPGGWPELAAREGFELPEEFKK